MDKLTVLDGDFELQLHRYLNSTETLGPAFALQALKYNRYAVYKTHLDYLRAGAQIIRTNTYRMSLSSISNFLNLNPTCYVPMIKLAVRLAKQAIYKYYKEKGGDCSNFEMFQLYRPRLAGTCSSFNISCFTSTLETSRNYQSLDFLTHFHRKRVKAFLAASVDLLAFESIPTAVETEAIIAVLKKYPNIPITITFLCQQEGKLMDGSIFADITAYITISLPNQILAIGADCSVSDSVKTLMRNINDSRYFKIPFMFYVDKHLVSSTVDKSTAALQHNFVQEYLDIGVRFIGGGFCTNAEDVKKIYEQVHNYYVSRGKTANLVNVCSYPNIKTKSRL